MKYSILMPCFARPNQLHNTFLSFSHHYSSRDDYEVIICHDTKEKTLYPDVWKATLQVVKEWSDRISINMFEGGSAGVSNPCIAYNQMADMANGEFLILTNPECFHENDVLGGFDELLSDNCDDYIVCACKDSVYKPQVFKADTFEGIRFEFKQWIQHTVHTNRCLHFCSVISKGNYKMIGGFDEMYRFGSGREDVDFLETIKKNNIQIRPTDALVVCHQQHPHSQDTSDKRQININYYREKWGEFTSNPVVTDHV